MAEFLTSQLDYVYFAYGLALVLLGTVATAISRSAPDRLPWGWFAAFAYAHGVVEWLFLLELATGNSPALSTVVTVLLLGNYLLLLEFARRSQGVLGGATPGPWPSRSSGASRTSPRPRASSPPFRPPCGRPPRWRGRPGERPSR
jgi:hypothetical protein